MKTLVFVAAQEHTMFGGSEELWLQACSRLQQLGYRIFASVPEYAEKYPRYKALNEQGVSFLNRRPLELQRHLWSRRILRGIGIRTESAFKQSVAQVLRQRPNLVVISQPCYLEGIEWGNAMQEANVPYVLISHNINHTSWLQDEFALRGAKAYRGARRVYVVAEKIREMIEEQLGVRLLNATVVRNPFNVPFSAHLDWPDEQQGIHLAMVGRVDPASKAQDVVIKTLALDKWRNRQISVDIYGTGKQLDVLQALVGMSGNPAVNFKGFCSNISEIWSTHHALLHPSRFEGLPMSVIEAMVCARPVIATAVGGIGEIVEDGVSGFLAQAPTIDLLDELLERAWQNKTNLQQMGVQARARIEKLVPPDPVGEFCQQLIKLT